MPDPTDTERDGCTCPDWPHDPDPECLRRSKPPSMPERDSEPVPETLYTMRCGWCGAYEGAVDPAEPCAQDSGTGEYSGPHQFTVVEAYPDPLYSAPPTVDTPEPDGWQYNYVTVVSRSNWQHFVSESREKAELQAWDGRRGKGPTFIRPVYYGEPVMLTEPPEHDCAAHRHRGVCRICGAPTPSSAPGDDA